MLGLAPVALGDHLHVLSRLDLVALHVSRTQIVPIVTARYFQRLHMLDFPRLSPRCVNLRLADMADAAVLLE